MERTEICQPPEFTGETIGEMYKNLIARAARISDVDDIIGDDYDIDRLRELVQADRDRRCVVFKFGLGSTVYRTWVRPDGSHPFISEENMNTVQDLVNAETWPDAYNTREAADAALKGWQNDHE